MRLAVWMLAIEFVGIISPLFLLPGRLFAGPHHAPTLEGQYVLKDIILVAAALVIAAAAFRGGRLVRGDLAPTKRVRDGVALDPEQQLRIVLDGMGDQSLVDEAEARTGSVKASLALLPDAQQEVITPAFYGQLTHTEIADRLGLASGTVKGRMRLGLQKLRASIEQTAA